MGLQIEYALTGDGVRLATLALGEGKPLLIAATPPWSHVLLESAIPPMMAWLGAIGQHARVVRYDCRGTGLSDRQPLDFSVEAQVRDMEAVADHYGLGPFAIWGAIGGSPAAIAYASRHPDRVSHVFLWGAYARGTAFVSRNAGAWGALLRENWEMYTDAYAQAAFGWPDSDTAARYADLTRAAITQEGMLAFVRAMSTTDVTASARDMRTPTLVMTRRDAKHSGVAEAREMAAMIPAARLLILDGSSAAPFLDDAASVVSAIREFMASDEAPRPRKPTVALTEREMQVLALLAQGRTGKEMAAKLGISVATTQRHLANIYAKIGARGRVEAAAYAFERGIGGRDPGGST